LFLTYVVSTTIVTDADKDVLVTNYEEVDYMEVYYNNVHPTVNESTESNQNPTHSFQILPNMKPEDVNPILNEYQSKYATKERPRVVTQHKGEIHPSIPSIPSIQTCQTIDGREPTYPTRQELIKSCQMKPKPNKFFVVDDPDLNDVVLFLLGKERRGLLDEKDWANLGQADCKYKQLVDRTRYLLNIDFTPLQQPRNDYEEQKQISQDQIDQADACLLHYGGEIGMLVRYCGGEYTAEHRDVKGILTAVKPHVNE
jgi:hypothetical protein